MPTYESKCNECDKHFKQIRPMRQSANNPTCCGHMTETVINWSGGFHFKGGAHFEAYECPVSGDVVTNHKQRHEVESKHDVTVVEPGMWEKPIKQKAPELPDELKTELQPALDKLANDTFNN